MSKLSIYLLFGLLFVPSIVFAAYTKCYVLQGGTVCLNATTISSPYGNITMNSTANNYPTNLTVNQTGSSYSVVLGRNGLGDLMGNFSVSGTGGGIGYVNTTGANFNSTNWFIRMINDTTAQAAGVSCNAGDAISTLSNNSVCTSFITPAALLAFGYISSAPNVNVTGFTGSGSTVQLNLSNGSILNATVTGGSGTGNISYNGNGTAGYIPRLTNSTNMNNSLLFDNGSAITANANVSISYAGISSSNPTMTLINSNAGRTQTLHILRPGVGGLSLQGAGGTPSLTSIAALNSSYGTAEQLFFVLATSTNYSFGDIFMASSPTTQNPSFMYDASTQRIGIGTNQPNSSLQVLGDINITGSMIINNTQVCLQNGTNCPAAGSGNTSSNLNNQSIPKWNGSALINSTAIDNGSSLIVNNLTIMNYTFVGRGATGGNPLRLFPVDEQYGYTQIAFYPEANTSHKEGDVLFNIHKIEDPSNATHRHMSIYTTGDTFTSMKKRLDIDYGTNFSNFTIQNTDQFKVYADSLLFSSVNTNVFNTERVDWGEVRLDYDETTNITTFNFNLQANYTNNSAQVRLFRESVVNNGLFIIYKGDNSTNKTFTVYANTGDLRDVGNITTSTGSVNDNRIINLNGNRALVGYNGSSTYAFLQGGSGKGINLQTDGANSRINITPNGNVTIDGSTFFVNAGSDEVNMTANVSVRGGFLINNTQVCLQNGTNCPAGGSGNVTATNGTAGYVGVFSSASNLVAMLINSTMIGDAAINATHLYTSNSGSNGQVLTLNSTGGMNWSTPTTGTSTSGGNASINGDGVFGTYTIQKNTTEIVSGNLTENGVLRYPNNATFSKYLNIGGTVFPYNQPRRFKIAELEFLRGGTNTGGIESLALSTFSSGSSAAGTGNADHPGVLILQDSATALGGSGIFSDVGAFLLAGGENFTVIFQIRSGQTGNSTTKIGFHDVGGAGWATDGCYWSFDNWGTGTGGPTRQAEPKCASNSAQTKTTNFTYTNNTWYVGNIYVDPTATNVTFTIMNETGGVLQSDSITSNIPKAAGRETGAGVIFTQNTTSAAAPGVYLDYLSLVINRELNRGLQQ